MKTPRLEEMVDLEMRSCGHLLQALGAMGNQVVLLWLVWGLQIGMSTVTGGQGMGEPPAHIQPRCSQETDLAPI